MGRTWRRVSAGSDSSLRELSSRLTFEHGGAVTVRSLLILVLLLVAAAPASASTYYISKSTGLDSNSSTQAQSKATPWAHLPGMASWTGSYSPAAGDTFILMGCDVWVSSDLPIYFTWAGSSGSPITVGGEDKTWYNTTNCPTTWNRPVFSNPSDSVFVTGENCAGSNAFACVSGNGYVVFDNIEMTGLTCTGGCSGAPQSYIHAPACQNCKFTNNYFHGLNIAYDNGGACTLMRTYETNSVAGTLFQSNIFSGLDSTAYPSGVCDAFYGDYGGATIDSNVIHDLTNGILFYASGGDSLVISNNLIYNILTTNGANHCNLMEAVGGGTFYVYNNVLHDLTCSGGEALMDGNNSETMYFWNNVIYNITNGQPPNFPQTSGQSITSLNYWNNTIVTGNGLNCFYYSGQGGGTLGTLSIQNNHCITTASSATGSFSGITITTQTVASNVLMTPTTATSQGYTSSETYAYSPPNASGGTVGAGTNLTSTCSGNLSGLCSDTTYATERTPIARPASGAWDVGAYEFGDSPAPQPPSNVQATAH